MFISGPPFAFLPMAALRPNGRPTARGRAFRWCSARRRECGGRCARRRRARHRPPRSGPVAAAGAEDPRRCGEAHPGGGRVTTSVQRPRGIDRRHHPGHRRRHRAQVSLASSTISGASRADMPGPSRGPARGCPRPLARAADGRRQQAHLDARHGLDLHDHRRRGLTRHRTIQRTWSSPQSQISSRRARCLPA